MEAHDHRVRVSAASRCFDACVRAIARASSAGFATRSRRGASRRLVRRAERDLDVARRRAPIVVDDVNRRSGPEVGPEHHLHRARHGGACRGSRSRTPPRCRETDRAFESGLDFLVTTPVRREHPSATQQKMRARALRRSHENPPINGSCVMQGRVPPILGVAAPSGTRAVGSADSRISRPILRDDRPSSAAPRGRRPRSRARARG